MNIARKGMLFIGLMLTLSSCASGGAGQHSGGGTPVASVSSIPDELGRVTSIEGGRVDNAAMTLFLFVEKDVSSVSLSQLISVTEGTSWKLYRGEQEIPTKIAASQGGSLADGDNQFKIVTSLNDGLTARTYTLTIHRSFMAKIFYYHNEMVLYEDYAFTGHEYTIKTSLKMKGYTFGYVTDKTGKTVQGTVTPWENLSYFVVATPRQCSVNLDPNGGSVEDSTLEIAFDSTYTLPDPTRKGYQFLGWFEGHILFPQTGVWKYDELVNLTAQWTIITYKVSYDLNGGDNDPRNPTSYTVEDEDITLYGPTRFGYDFLGWIDGDKTNVTVISKGSTGDLKLTADFRVQTYSITYLTDEETTNQNPDTYTVKDGIIHLNDPQKEGWQFYGWLNENDEIVEDIDSKDLTDVTLRPCWGTPGLTITERGVLKSLSLWDSHIVIPEIVKTIADKLFYNSTRLVSVSIPKSMKSIPDSAFFGCSALSSVKISEGVESIGKEAFRGCKSLASVKIPSSVSTIGTNAFYGCTSLSSINIPNGVFSMSDGAFSNCSSLRSIYCERESEPSHWPSGWNGSSAPIWGVKDIVTSDGLTYAIVGKREPYTATLVDSKGTPTNITVPSVVDGFSVTAIGGNAFRGSASLVSVSIPEGVSSIGASAFSNCYALASIEIPEGVTAIGDYAFTQCHSLSSVMLPEGLESIGHYAFYMCLSLSSIVIPDGVKSIGLSAFGRCSSLSSVVIADSVKSVGAGAFCTCSSLHVICCKGEKAAYGWRNDWKDNDSTVIWEMEKIVTLDGLVYAIINKSGSRSAALIGYEGALTDISVPAVIDGARLSSVIAYAFSDCVSLSSVEIPNGVTSIGEFAFSGCASLASIIIPSSVTSVGDNAFSGCSALSSIEIPNSVTSIGEFAFSGCASLTSLIIPNNVLSIGRGAFSGCVSLVSVIIQGGIISIVSEMFYDCASLTSVVIPSNVTEIEKAFSGCTSLRNVYYCGTATDWRTKIKYSGGLEKEMIVFFYSEEKPSEEGRYWHYVNNSPEPW